MGSADLAGLFWCTLRQQGETIAEGVQMNSIVGGRHHALVRIAWSRSPGEGLVEIDEVCLALC